VLHIFSKGWESQDYSWWCSLCSSRHMGDLKGLGEKVQAQSGRFFTRQVSTKRDSQQNEQAKRISVMLQISTRRQTTDLEYNWTCNWLHSQLRDRAPEKEMMSWKFTLCGFINHYSKTARSDFLETTLIGEGQTSRLGCITSIHNQEFILDGAGSC
jgi:hypothetical protein